MDPLDPLGGLGFAWEVHKNEVPGALGKTVDTRNTEHLNPLMCPNYRQGLGNLGSCQILRIQRSTCSTGLG